jgi:tRNA threonylcarbamoyladenosine biosynthesis protein TsaE
VGKEEQLVTESASETQKFFRQIAPKLKPGDVVGFVGELGTGKTVAVQSILKSFGEEGGESPTFVIIRPYKMTKPKKGISLLVHVDAYRLPNQQDAETTGLRDFLKREKSLVLVEWADRLQPMLPAHTIWVKLAHLGGDKRAIKVIWP